MNEASSNIPHIYTIDGRKCMNIAVTFEEFSTIPDNPIQRDTEARVKRASRKHLKTASITHVNVATAVIRGGGEYVVDGHTRRHLWMNGTLEAPTHVSVTRYFVDTIDEVIALYKQYDNASAVETAKDRISGAMNGLGFKPKNHMLKRASILGLFYYIEGLHSTQVNIYTDVEKYLPYLKVIDDADIAPIRFPAGIFTALMLTVIVDGEAAFEFWHKYANDEGTKDSRGRCAVQALNELFLTHRGKSAAEVCEEMMLKALSAYKGYKRNTIYAQGLKSSSLSYYLNKNISKLPEWLADLARKM